MWKKLFEAVKRLFGFAESIDRHEKEIAALRRELRDVSVTLERLVFEFERLRDNEHYERQNLELRLENQLLRFERRLPPAKADTYDKEMD